MTNADNAFEMIQSFLSEPGAKEKLSEALEMFGGGNISPPTESVSSEKNEVSFPFSDIDPQKLLQLMTAFKKLEKDPDPRSDLLMALKPYLSDKKNSSVDKALKAVKLFKYAPLLGNLKDIADIF